MECSKGLWAQLTTGDSVHGASAVINRSAALREECAAMLPVLQERATALAGDEGVAFHLAKNALALSVPSMTDPAAWREAGKIYMDTLRDLPTWAIEKAFSSWHACEMYPKEPGRHVFFPKPAELHFLATKHAEAARMAAYRARKALDYRPPQEAWTPERKRAEIEKAREMGLLPPKGDPIQTNILRSIPRETPGGEDIVI